MWEGGGAARHTACERASPRVGGACARAPQGGVQLDDEQLAAWVDAATVEHASAAQAAWLWQWLREPSTAAEREAVAAGGC